jgi:hypothetical protein
MEEATKEVRDKKAKRNNDALGILEEFGLKLITQTISTTYETGERPKDLNSQLFS